ncbi:TetR/AcrR family transcriptional regulator [Shimia sp. NS0008-38b]|uniref:TetR/AcrR family transcriptional regulator n=1 Tax=Shimia sp. NS0008-38b TaxID=3127653 RepID=UPI0033406AAC
MDRKTQLLDSAEDLVRRRGFDGMSFADMALANDIKTASIHYHFPGKAALGVALMKRYAKTLGDELNKMDANGLTARAKLEAVVARYRAALNGGESMCLCVAMSVSRDNLAEPIIVEMRAFRGMMLDWLEGLYKQACDDKTLATTAAPSAQAAATLAMLEGAQMIAHTENDASRFDAATSMLLSAPQ